MTAKELEQAKKIANMTLYKRELFDSHHLNSYDYFKIDMTPINQALTELEAIKSANGGEAMDMLNKINNETYLETYYDEDGYSETIEHNVFFEEDERLEYLKNYILKSQQQAKELAELKKKVVKYVNLSKYAVSGDLEDNEFLEFWELGDKLCKGSEER